MKNLFIALLLIVVFTGCAETSDVHEVISSPNAPAAIGPYSQAVRVGDMLYLSGQLGLSPETGKFAGQGFDAQARQALAWIDGLGVEAVAAHEDEMLRYGTELLSEIPGLRIVGTARHKAGVLSFVLDGVHPHDIGTVLDYEGVAVRTGHHCAQPVMDRFGIPATARASLACFNNRADLEALAAGIRRVQEMFK